MTPPRVGARRRADIPAALLAQFNMGTLPTATLVEHLAINMAVLAGHVARDVGLSPPARRAVIGAAESAAPLGVVRRMEVIGRAFAAAAPAARTLARLARHPSDTARGWAAYALQAAQPGEIVVAAALAAVEPLADDLHAGVREWAWMAWRPHLAADLGAGLRAARAWTQSADANLRRFASEATRPRGVWCACIRPLVDKPSRGRLLLQALKADPSRYVQTSVGNWLNDAAKSDPAWVSALGRAWLNGSATPATRWIVNHGTRTLRRGAAGGASA